MVINVGLCQAHLFGAVSFWVSALIAEVVKTHRANVLVDGDPVENLPTSMGKETIIEAAVVDLLLLQE